ncbi:TetR/AcrR family transcriptional regulator [Natranaerofaba carboxydovora]|uniref:TetR/AcrR family transcriptional regulator n=1 Tax=Natranaerofaba carboxydovora TaxID=2742683 RepID=UPI001F13309B|nr:helix-turn-helix domain-containing protein [Natranaerofaba carboxydovora]UMZ72798.1 Bacterial regulatory protein, tetR family [Natranaerofaba carboxydovora]
MPPKTKVNKERIIETAFEIAKENGFSKVTARNVAKHLGCSVAPIYVNFETIDDLISEVVKRVFALSNELLATQNGENMFENIGKASLEFAREYPILFRELVIEPNQYMKSYEEFEEAMLQAMSEDKEMSSLTFEERRKLLFKMRVFQLGLSVMVANGHIPSYLDDKAVEKLLMETGEELLQVQKIKKGDS